MTPPEDLARIDSVIDNTHCRAADSLTINRRTVKSLAADSRALAELVAALPKCCTDECDRIATHVASTYGGNFADEFDCDKHAHEEHEELPYAFTVRKLGLKGTTDG